MSDRSDKLSWSQRVATLFSEGDRSPLCSWTHHLEIRDDHLYRDDHKTFEQYCDSRWSFGKRYAGYLVQSAEVTENLGTMVPILPAKERQTRELAKVDDPEKQREAWTSAVEAAGGEQPTAKQVKAALILTIVRHQHHASTLKEIVDILGVARSATLGRLGLGKRSELRDGLKQQLHVPFAVVTDQRVLLARLRFAGPNLLHVHQLRATLQQLGNGLVGGAVDEFQFTEDIRVAGSFFGYSFCGHRQVLWASKSTHSIVIDNGQKGKGCNKPIPGANAWLTNLSRRHLDESQRAMVGGRMRSFFDKEAKGRQKASGGNQKTKAVPEKLPEPVKGDSRDKAGEAVNVSGKTIGGRDQKRGRNEE